MLVATTVVALTGGAAAVGAMGLEGFGAAVAYFSLGSEWDDIKKVYKFTDEDVFKLFNESFLDDGINERKIFYFSHNPINDRGALGDEYRYLLKNGYEWNDMTQTMSPRK